MPQGSSPEKQIGFRLQLIEELNNMWKTKKPKDMPPVATLKQEARQGLLRKKTVIENPFQDAVIGKIRTTRYFVEQILGAERVERLALCFVDGKLGLHGHGDESVVDALLTHLEGLEQPRLDACHKRLDISANPNEFVDHNDRALQYHLTPAAECIALARTEKYDEGVTVSAVELTLGKTQQHLRKLNIGNAFYVLKRPARR